MKSEWEFMFEVRGFRFEQEVKYKIEIDRTIRLEDNPISQIDCFVRITPNEKESPAHVEQVGSLFVMLPYLQKETRNLAFHIASTVADRITFQQGDFRIKYGLVIHKRVAETREEEQEFGDKLYSMDLRFEEVVHPSQFNSKEITKNPSIIQHPALIAQFNETKRDTSPIRKFLGFFRILESIYHIGKDKLSLKEVLKQSEDLREIHQMLAMEASFEELISELVEVRHRCAHLKLSKGFGYVPVDPAVEREVKPLISTLATMAHCSIMGPDSWKRNA